MAFVTVNSGQTVTGHYVTNEYLQVYSGGTVTATTVEANGFLEVYTGGSATGTIVSYSGFEILMSGGHDSSATVNSGGYLLVDAGAVASGTVISKGAFVTVTGGAISNALVSAGAYVDVSKGGMLTGATFQPGAGADFADIPYSANATATLNAATDILTITGGGTTSTVQLAGNYTGDTFSLSSDFSVLNFGQGPAGTNIMVNAARANPDTEVTNVYEAVLQRAPDTTGLAFWSNGLGSGSVPPIGFSYAIATSQEAQANVVPIVDVYTTLGRAPDQAGLQFWVQQYEAGTSLNVIAGDFLASPEGQQVYGSPVVASAASDAAFVNTAYQKVLGRSADAGGFALWTDTLHANAITPGAVLADLALSPEGQARDASAATNFLIAAANGTANYGGSLFPTG